MTLASIGGRTYAFIGLERTTTSAVAVYDITVPSNATFGSATFALANFGTDQGWRSNNSFHRELADVNGDGRADIVGFGQSGVFAAIAFDGQVI